MKNRLLILGILVMALAFGMTVLGCDDKDGGGSTDDTFEVYTWTEADIGTNITSLMQLNGTWKGSYTDNQKGKVTVYIEIDATNADMATMLASESYSTGPNMEGVSAGGGYIRLSDMNGIQINQDGTKIKVPAGILGFPSEIILKKYSGSIPGTGGSGDEPILVRPLSKE